MARQGKILGSMPWNSSRLYSQGLFFFLPCWQRLTFIAISRSSIFLAQSKRQKTMAEPTFSVSVVRHEEQSFLWCQTSWFTKGKTVPWFAVPFFAYSNLIVIPILSEWIRLAIPFHWNEIAANSVFPKLHGRSCFFHLPLRFLSSTGSFLMASIVIVQVQRYGGGLWK